MEMLEILKEHPIVPVLVLHDLEDAIPIAEALISGGINIIEVTLRTPVALEGIQLIKNHLPDMIVGVGTVLTPKQFSQAKAAGVHFVVSPSFLPELSDAAKENQLPFLPGAVTPTEITTVKQAGYKVIKYFPAESAGGVKQVKTLGSVFPDIYFCPTGGINRSNIQDYLTLDNVVSVGGSWLITQDEISEKSWDTITMMAKEAMVGLTTV